MSSIELAMYVKDEVRGIASAIESALLAGVDSVFIWDTGSTDGTPDIVEGRSRLHRSIPFRVFDWPVPEEAVDFGAMETAVCWMAKGDWVLRLDGDEMISTVVDLHDLIDGHFGAWKMPRYRWADLERRIQLEVEAFPDFQYRFFRNDGQSRYVGLIHPTFETSHPIGDASGIVDLHHFVDPLHLSNPVRVEARNRLYRRLATRAGKAPEGSPEGMRLAGHQDV